MNSHQQAPGRIDGHGLSIRLGQGREAFEAVQRLDFAVAPGEFVCILGPSGCGKSTLLGALAGHLVPSSGQLSVDGQAIAGPSPQRGMVFQHHTLLPWRSVLDNVGFGLKMQGLGKAERRQQAGEMLQLVGLADFAERWPSQLSGGMQQRAEIARVLINRPRRASLLTSPEFTHLKRHCLALLRHEEGRELPRLTPLGLPATDHPPLRIAL